MTITIPDIIITAIDEKRKDVDKSTFIQRILEKSLGLERIERADYRGRSKK
jgi:hypothetical protein